ncbi:MAG TPA: hypothetical protein VK567_05035, partial [Bradyrhizobium sp.]|nr:hypothetical protein [Bradyrhizobium sp.]
ATLPIALRPTLGIQLAPPTVGAVAYLGINGGVPDLVAHALVGYGLLQALLLLRLLPWSSRLPYPIGASLSAPRRLPSRRSEWSATATLARSHIWRLIFLPARISPSALSRLELCG